MNDEISKLPVVNEKPTPIETQILDTYFKREDTKPKTVISEFKETLLVGCLFLVFSLKQSGDLIRYIFKAAESPLILLLFKAIAMMVSYYILKNRSTYNV